jgi:protein-S-isoprenylcysteine O-methyltransferase Ste14
MSIRNQVPMTYRAHPTNAPPVGRTILVARNWRWSNVPLPEAHIGLMTVGVVAHVLRPWPIGSGRSLRQVGWLLIVTGVALAAWATREAGSIDLRRPDRVVTSGPYSVSRHPMYMAWTLIFVGVGLVFNTAWLVILLAPLAALIQREMRTEEDRLRATFGVEYEAYRTRVRRHL